MISARPCILIKVTFLKQFALEVWIGKVTHVHLCFYIVFQIFNAARSSFAPEEEKRQMLEDLVKIYGEH